MTKTIAELDADLRVVKNDIEHIKDNVKKMEKFQDNIFWYVVIAILLGILAKLFGFL